jgi:predicted metal-dependent peptidase
MLMIARQAELTAAQRLTKAVGAIIGSPHYTPVTGLVLMAKHTVVPHGKDGIETAATNGVTAMYSDKFIDGISDADLRFTICHETWHILYLHLTTYADLWKLDAACANAACDYVINMRLLDHDKRTQPGFITMPTGGLYDEQYRNMTVPQVFKALYKQKQGQPKNGQGNPQPGGQGQGQPQPGQGPGKPLDKHDWAGAGALSDEQKKNLERAVQEAAQQGALLAGKTGSGGNRMLDDVLDSKIDWREVLREFVTTTCTGSDYSTWARPNRRYWGAGIYLPSGISEKVDELVIAIDTSGSIDGRMIAQFMGEVAGICESVKPAAVRILYWDTDVCGDEVYADDQIPNIIHSTKPVGGGGTRVSCVSDYMSRQGITPQAVIVLTDGYLGSDWGTWTVPVLWCIVDNASRTAPNGTTVHVEI